MPTSRPIDAVIAWVDGNDPNHIAKRAHWSNGAAHQAHQNATETTRFVESGEIYWCIASILKFAPFIRYIWLVTDDQRPALLDDFADSGLCGPDKIRVVDHRTLFAGHEDALPTFNSRTIEALLWTIPDLSENFVFFNDDFFLNAPAAATDFVHDDGRPRLQGRMRRASLSHRLTRQRAALRRIFSSGSLPSPGHELAQYIAAKEAGMSSRFLVAGHVPHSLRRSVMQRFYADRPDLLRNQLSHRFRHHTHHIPFAAANAIEMKCHGTPHEPEPPIAYFRADRITADDPVLDVIRNEGAPFGCIQSLDLATPAIQHTIARIMTDKFRSHLPDGVIDRAMADKAPDAGQTAADQN